MNIFSDTTHYTPFYSHNFFLFKWIFYRLVSILLRGSSDCELHFIKKKRERRKRKEKVKKNRTTNFEQSGSESEWGEKDEKEIGGMNCNDHN